mmetsp:Transcript_35955/g.78772  ORF Transcript_35955/g.78772 Transcript_35955/m.78772 type:complete len:266 (-) Transcript_35955:221-1018(-)
MPKKKKLTTPGCRDTPSSTRTASPIKVWSRSVCVPPTTNASRDARTEASISSTSTSSLTPSPRLSWVLASTLARWSGRTASTTTRTNATRTVTVTAWTTTTSGTSRSIWSARNTRMAYTLVPTAPLPTPLVSILVCSPMNTAPFPPMIAPSPTSKDTSFPTPPLPSTPSSRTSAPTAGNTAQSRTRTTVTRPTRTMSSNSAKSSTETPASAKRTLTLRTPTRAHVDTLNRHTRKKVPSRPASSRGARTRGTLGPSSLVFSSSFLF